MRHVLLGLGLLLPLLSGCSGENVVAGEEQTKAEQLASELPSWCSSTCERLLACPESAGCDCNGDVCECSGVDAGCEKQCPLSFARYTHAGEFCASVGQRIQKCIDDMKCQDLKGEDWCKATAAENQACPEPNEFDGEDPPSAVGNPLPNTGSAGPSGNSSSSSAGPNAVSCADSTAAGGGGPANGGAQVTCEEARSSCTDQRVYSWICSQDSQGQRACACLVDSRATASFVPNSADCPLLAQVNAGCGWALLQ